MATTQDDVVVRLRLKDVAKFIADVKSGRLAIEDLEKKISKAGRTADKESSPGGGFSKLADHFKTVAGWAARGTTALAFAGAGVAAYAIKSAANLEQVTMSFETLLGSAAKAKSMVADLQTFARVTPFELPDVEKGAQKLLAFGFAANSIIPSMTAIGNAVSGLNLGPEGFDRVITALGQIRMKGRVQGDEMLQLAEAGINANAYLERAFHLTPQQLQKAQQAGKISAAAAIPVILKGMDDQFHGLMAKQSTTLGGIWSNFHDAMQQGLIRLVSPFLPAMKVWLQQLVDAMPQIEAFVQRVMNDGIAGVQIGIEFGKTVVASIQDAIETGDWSGIGGAVGTQLRNLLTGGGSAAGGVDWFDIGQKVAGGAISFGIGFLSALFDPTVWWPIIQKHWFDILMLLLTAVPLGKLLGVVGKVLSKIPLIRGLAPWFERAGAALIKIGGPIWGLVERIGKGIGDAFIKVFPEMGTRIWYFFARIKEIFTEGIPGIGRAIRDWFGALPEKLFTWMFTAIKRMGDAVATGARKLFDPIIERFQAVITWATGAWSAFLGTLGLPGQDGGSGTYAPPPGGANGGTAHNPGPLIMPGMAAGGGTVGRSGATWVGERGPELLNLPRGAQVIPLPRGGAASQPLHVHVEVNGREIATAVLDDLNARAARR